MFRVSDRGHTNIRSSLLKAFTPVDKKRETKKNRTPKEARGLSLAWERTISSSGVQFLAEFTGKTEHHHLARGQG